MMEARILNQDASRVGLARPVALEEIWFDVRLLASGGCQQFLVFLVLRHATPVSASVVILPLHLLCVSNLSFPHSYIDTRN